MILYILNNNVFILIKLKKNIIEAFIIFDIIYIFMCSLKLYKCLDSLLKLNYFNKINQNMKSSNNEHNIFQKFTSVKMKAIFIKIKKVVR